MPVMVTAATREKNSKIRGLCCGYVALLAEAWDSALLIRCADDFEAVIRAAVGDSSAEGRQVGGGVGVAGRCERQCEGGVKESRNHRISDTEDAMNGNTKRDLRCMPLTAPGRRMGVG